VQLLEIAVVEKPTDYLACALWVKQVPGRELKPLIGAGQRSHEARRPSDSITTTPAARPSEWPYVNQKRCGGSDFLAIGRYRPRVTRSIRSMRPRPFGGEIVKQKPGPREPSVPSSRANAGAGGGVPADGRPAEARPAAPVRSGGRRRL
jgi:hypothetical protein